MDFTGFRFPVVKDANLSFSQIIQTKSHGSWKTIDLLL